MLSLLALSLSMLNPTPVQAAEPFLWGVANAAFQAEGSPEPSDWNEWSHQPGRIKDGSTADVATDFWNRYDEDFALTQQLGAGAFRMSLAWERIEPARGQWNEEALEHYARMIAAMRARGLEPIVTLLHSVLPNWVAHENGIVGKNFPTYFAEYAEKAVQVLSSGPAGVRYWMTLNEPATQAEGKYLDGEDPSDFYDKDGKLVSIHDNTGLFMKAMRGQVLAHLAAAGRIQALRIPGLKLGVATDWTVLQEKTKNPIGGLVKFFAERMYDRYFLDGIVFGKNSLCLTRHFLCPGFKRPGNKPSVDYIGVNYYTRELISVKLFPPGVDFVNGPGPVSDRDMEIYPEGLEMALKKVWDLYKIPPMISENGIADRDDHQRPDFLKAHLAYLKKAREQDGIPVLGYLYWSLTDNFNWSGGLGEKLGLVSIDAKTLDRKIRPSYYTYQDLISLGR